MYKLSSPGFVEYPTLDTGDSSEVGVSHGEIGLSPFAKELPFARVCYRLLSKSVSSDTIFGADDTVKIVAAAYGSSQSPSSYSSLFHILVCLGHLPKCVYYLISALLIEMKSFPVLLLL